MKVQLPILFALGTALCWGCYGPVLGQARSVEKAIGQAGLSPKAIGNSPFKSYVFIGIAYLVWALLGGLIGMKVKGDEFTFFGDLNTKSTALAFMAGTLGAWGALNLTLAMASGGMKMPHVVMPVVFGGAVTVTAIISVIQFGSPNKWLMVGILGMGGSIILVAANTPHAPGAHKQAHGAETKTQAEGASGEADNEKAENSE